MPKEMIFLVEQDENRKFKAVNLNFNIRIFANSYEEIKESVHSEILKLNLISMPETVRFRFVREEIDKFF